MSDNETEDQDYEFGRDVAKNATQVFFGRVAQIRFRSVFTPYRVLEMYEQIDELKARESKEDIVKPVDNLSASEALFAFCAWLNSRDRSITMSANQNAARVVELIHKFCEVNDLALPVEGWHDRAKEMIDG